MRNFNNWKIAIAGIVVFLAFPFVYLGGTKSNYFLITIGMSMLVGGVAATPVITFFEIRHKHSK